MTERWHLGTWLGKRFHTEDHTVARKGDGLVIRSRAVKLMSDVTTSEDLDAIKGSPWAPSGVLEDVLPDVPRPVLRRDEPFVPDEECPVPRKMKITHDLIKRFGYTPGCAKCRKLSRSEYSHPSLAHSQVCRLRIERASKSDPVYRDRVERAEQRKIDFYAKEVERSDRSRRVTVEPEVVLGTPAGETDTADHSGGREVKQPRGEPQQDLSGEIPIPSADETLHPPELQTSPSSSTSIPFPFLSLFEQWCETYIQ